MFLTSRDTERFQNKIPDLVYLLRNLSIRYYDNAILSMICIIWPCIVFVKPYRIIRDGMAKKVLGTGEYALFNIFSAYCFIFMYFEKASYLRQSVIMRTIFILLPPKFVLISCLLAYILRGRQHMSGHYLNFLP